MSQAKIFNDYDDDGFRRNIVGCKSHYTTDNQIVYNLRFRWKTELTHLSDQQLLNEYDEFAMSDQFGFNDDKFLDWINEVEQ